MSSPELTKDSPPRFFGTGIYSQHFDLAWTVGLSRVVVTSASVGFGSVGYMALQAIRLCRLNWSAKLVYCYANRKYFKVFSRFSLARKVISFLVEDSAKSRERSGLSTVLDG